MFLKAVLKVTSWYYYILFLYNKYVWSCKCYCILQCVQSGGMQSFLFFYIYIYLFIFYFWLCWVFVSVRGPSPVEASGGHSSSRCAGLSLSRPLLLRSTGSRRAGSVIVAHGPSCSGACGIFPDQGSNPCPCIGRQTLNHCATREARNAVILKGWPSGTLNMPYISMCLLTMLDLI